MSISLILLVLSSICRASAADHAIYLSVTEIRKTDDSTVIMTVKVFRDDLVDALRLANDEKLRSTMDTLDHDELTGYFNEHIRFYPNPGLDVELSDYSVEGDSFFIDFNVLRSLDSIEECGISHFFELFPNQKNILKVNLQDEVVYKTFSSKEQVEKIE